VENRLLTSSSIIELDRVSKKYQMGEACVTALDCISLRVIPGEFLVVLGPSGSGRVTLLNLIGTLDSASPGDICVKRAVYHAHESATAQPLSP